MSAGAPLLSLRNLCKSYGAHQVLKSVSLTLRAGEIRAVVGENGAGKSTLMNVLFGMPVIHETGGFEGTVEMHGETKFIDSPRRAMELGIGMVHQEFVLVPGFTVAQNVKLNREPCLPSVFERFATDLRTLDGPAMVRDAARALETVGVSIDPDARVGGLPVGHKQFVEIAREVDRHTTRILVLDEPSAVLTESEAEILLQSMRRLQGMGVAILFISHRLDEVKAVADTVTVMRDGAVVADRAVSDLSKDEIAALMVGHRIEEVSLPERAHPVDPERVALRLRNYTAAMPGEAVDGIDLDVREGEILGIGGLAGYGKLAIANGLFGLARTAGQARLFDAALSLRRPGASVAAGLALVSEDRRGTGLVLTESIAWNIAIAAHLARGDFRRRLGGLPIDFFDGARAREHATGMITALDIRCEGPDQAVGRLSGGNQQKVAIARAITLSPRVLFVSEPTRGVDVGAKKRILDTLVAMNRDRGMSIVVTGSELAELRAVSDRIAIISRSRVAAILAPDAPDAHFGLAMAGESLH